MNVNQLGATKMKRDMERTIKEVIRIAFEEHPKLINLAVEVRLNGSLEPLGIFRFKNTRMFTWNFIEESHEEILHRFHTFCEENLHQQID